MLKRKDGTEIKNVAQAKEEIIVLMQNYKENHDNDNRKNLVNFLQECSVNPDLKKNYENFQYNDSNTEYRYCGQTNSNYLAYCINNEGRLQIIYTDGILQHQTEEIDAEKGKIRWGYLVLENQDLRKDYIYNFVAYTFLGKVEGSGYHVHHITNDGDDNSVNNLILLTAAEHSIVHGFKIGNF